jgi:hypothetical protein
MKLSVTVQYKNEAAHYSIIQEAAGVFLASLERYKGPLAEAPPTRIMLVKGIRRWTGSFEHQEILDKLGHAIELNLDQKRSKNNLHENWSTSSSDI